MVRVLIDYDNIPRDKRMKGLDFLIDRAIRLLGYEMLKMKARVNVRLYGGWYEMKRPTKVAQRLQAEIRRNYPKPLIVGGTGGVHSVIVSVELACSLAVEPTKDLWHTYRPRGLPPKLMCKSIVDVGCRINPCVLELVQKFFKNGKCPNKGCDVTPSEMLLVAQQKLVDTMLTVDLLHYAIKMKESVCVITSDDDLWPGIASAVVYGACIIHVHTRTKRRTSSFYVPSVKKNYIQLNL